MIHTLRQQMKKGINQANYALADFVAPKGMAGYMGAFTVCIHIDQKLQNENDDFRSIMIKAIADRFAEALAEALHEDIRREYWGYAPDEKLSNDDLIDEKYMGIRPAPGYPACPDHTEKKTIFELLGAEQNIQAKLTESFAILPSSAVSGYYFAHPDLRYFGIGKIESDQLNDYCMRKGWTLEYGQKWLAHCLNDA